MLLQNLGLIRLLIEFSVSLRPFPPAVPRLFLSLVDENSPKPVEVDLRSEAMKERFDGEQLQLKAAIDKLSKQKREFEYDLKEVRGRMPPTPRDLAHRHVSLALPSVNDRSFALHYCASYNSEKV